MSIMPGYVPVRIIVEVEKFFKVLPVLSDINLHIHCLDIAPPSLYSDHSEEKQEIPCWTSAV